MIDLDAEDSHSSERERLRMMILAVLQYIP